MEFTHRLQLARDLVKALESGNEAHAEGLVAALNEAKSKALLRQLADLTRDFHSAVGGVVSDPQLLEFTRSGMPDARQRLAYVAEKTEESVHRTLSAVEDMLPIAERLVISADELDQHLMAKATPRIALLREYVSANRAYGERMRSGLTEVLMAQEFQDLTGQVIKRTIEIVSALEQRLVGVIAAEWQPTKASGAVDDPLTPQGPAVRPQAHHVQHQTDVDELLASLGV